uniref:Nonsense-mediated mRNA decay factor n=1 Tax=Mastacembelus armatus TaxID=205130 RepID=A0A7N8YC70_9TELE
SPPLCLHPCRQAEALKADMTDSKLGAAEVWTSRQALQDLYQKMLVTDLEYALDKKVEQDLWNHAFKNQITTLQSQAKNRANPNRSEVQANLSLFLEAASGFYTQLLQELCTVFNVDLPCRVKSSQLGIISNKQSSSSAIVTPQPSSCSYICQHCLVHLGDIARYRNQTSQAESYYRHAAQLVPSNGQPYNQLAILASSKGDHLTTIFYYCRSIAVKFPFPAASTNLQKALSKALESRDEVKTKWSVSDFIKAFIKFHGHVYLSKSLDKLDGLREKLEEQFQRLILQKAFSSQQLVHITVINLFELHHLRDLTADSSEQSYSSEQQISWFQLLGLFMSFLGIMCSRVLLNKNKGDEVMGECPLPAIKVSLDWLRLRPRLFHDAAVDQRQYIWPWLVSILNSFQPKEDDVSCSSVTPLPEEFELQGFLALRPALRSLDFTKGHQGILVDRDGLPVHARHQRLIILGKWVADNQPGLIQYTVSEDGLLVFITDIPEQAIEEPQEKEAPVLQESSNGEQTPSEGGNSGLKSVLSVGKSQSSWPDGGDRPIVTFKENIKPREQSREPTRNQHQKDAKERRDFSKGNGAAGKGELKRDGKRKSELKKSGPEKTPDAGKQSQVELRKTPVSEAKKTPVTQTQTTCSSQFIPIHHPGAFPPLPSRPGFPPSAYVIPPPVAFPGLPVNPGFTFSTGVSVPGPFLQSAVHTQAGTQVQAGKQSHIPYSQQRPSGPCPGQGPGSSGQAPGTMTQGPSQGQQPQAHQQQQSPTKPVQQVGVGKSPPHHPGLQQYMQVQDQPAQIWNQAQAALQKMAPMQMPMKQQQPAFYMPAQDPLKLYEPQLQPPPQSQLSNMDKKIKYPDVKMQDFYWESSYRMGDGPAVMADRMKRPSPSANCSDQNAPSGPRRPPFEVSFSQCSCNQDVCVCVQEYNPNSIFRQAYGKNLPPSSKPDVPMVNQELSFYSLFERTPWSPSLPASSASPLIPPTPAACRPPPPTHNHGAMPFSNFGPIGTPDSRDCRLMDRRKTDKTEPQQNNHNSSSAESPMEESSSTVLLDSLKSIWSSSMMQPGPSALEQLLLQQKQKQQRGHGAMNPPH